MNIKVFEATNTTPIKPPVILRLLSTSAHDTNGKTVAGLYVVDEKGNAVPGGYLLDVKADGTFRRVAYVSKDIGLPLGPEGRIIVN